MKDDPRSTSRLPGFNRLSPSQRRATLVEQRWISAPEAAALPASCGFDEACADAMVENVIGMHGLPLAVALNFRVNGTDRLLPMAVEEPSIVAACSYAARLTLARGGFTAQADPPLIAAQVQLLDVEDEASAIERLEAQTEQILALANRTMPQMVARGGGAVELEIRVLERRMLCVHLIIDCRDAMGANTANSAAEAVAPLLAELSGGRYGLRILSNLADRRKVYLRAQVPIEALVCAGFPDGAAVRDAILEAQRFAELDPYRAATHNKGVMNGVDAVLVACGNDWRAVEAGAHAWAARTGRYQPLTRWTPAPDGSLAGELVMPLAASTVGGAAHSHPGVRAALALTRVEHATELAMLAGAAGLASNLAALRALSTEGIQSGHMALHARRIAAEAGAVNEQIEAVAAQLSKEKVYRPERARELILLSAEREKRRVAQLEAHGAAGLAG